MMNIEQSKEAQADLMIELLGNEMHKVIADKGKDTPVLDEFLKLEQVRQIGNIKEVISALQLGFERLTAK